MFDVGGLEMLYGEIECFDILVLFDVCVKVVLRYVDVLIWIFVYFVVDVVVEVCFWFLDDEVVELIFDIMCNVSNKVVVLLGVDVFRV